MNGQSIRLSFLHSLRSDQPTSLMLEYSVVENHQYPLYQETLSPHIELWEEGEADVMQAPNNVREAALVFCCVNIILSQMCHVVRPSQLDTIIRGTVCSTSCFIDRFSFANASHMTWNEYYILQYNLFIMDTLRPTKGGLVIKVSWFSRSVYVINKVLLRIII